MMDYGVHLPLIALDGRPWSLRRLLEHAEVAEGRPRGRGIGMPRPLREGEAAGRTFEGRFF